MIPGFGPYDLPRSQTVGIIFIIYIICPLVIYPKYHSDISILYPKNGDIWKIFPIKNHPFWGTPIYGKAQAARSCAKLSVSCFVLQSGPAKALREGSFDLSWFKSASGKLKRIYYKQNPKKLIGLLTNILMGNISISIIVINKRYINGILMTINEAIIELGILNGY